MQEYENISFELRRNSLGHIISDIHSFSRQSVPIQNFRDQFKQEMNGIIATDEMCNILRTCRNNDLIPDETL